MTGRALGPLLLLTLWLALGPGTAAAQDALAPAPAPEPDAARVAEFHDLIARNGCAMTLDEARSVLPGAGFPDMAEVRQIVLRLTALGHAMIDGPTLNVTGPGCENTDTARAEALFLEILAANGCRITFADAQGAFPEGGLDLRDGQAIALSYLGRGLASQGPDQMLILSEEVCTPAA